MVIFTQNTFVDCNYDLIIHCFAWFLSLLVTIVNSALEKVLLKVLGGDVCVLLVGYFLTLLLTCSCSCIFFTINSFQLFL